MSDQQTEMKIDPARAAALVSQLQAVQERIAAVAKGRAVRLLAFFSFPLKEGEGYLHD